MSSELQLQDLSQDLLLYICSYLDMKSVARLNEASHFFYNISNDNLIWEAFYRKFFYTEWYFFKKWEISISNWKENFLDRFKKMLLDSTSDNTISLRKVLTSRVEKLIPLIFSEENLTKEKILLILKAYNAKLKTKIMPWYYVKFFGKELPVFVTANGNLKTLIMLNNVMKSENAYLNNLRTIQFDCLAYAISFNHKKIVEFLINELKLDEQKISTFYMEIFNSRLDEITKLELKFTPHSSYLKKSNIEKVNFIDGYLENLQWAIDKNYINVNGRERFLEKIILFCLQNNLENKAGEYMVITKESQRGYPMFYHRIPDIIVDAEHAIESINTDDKRIQIFYQKTFNFYKILYLYLDIYKQHLNNFHLNETIENFVHECLKKIAEGFSGIDIENFCRVLALFKNTWPDFYERILPEIDNVYTVFKQNKNLWHEKDTPQKFLVYCLLDRVLTEFDEVSRCEILAKITKLWGDFTHFCRDTNQCLTKKIARIGSEEFSFSVLRMFVVAVPGEFRDDAKQIENYFLEFLDNNRSAYKHYLDLIKKNQIFFAQLLFDSVLHGKSSFINFLLQQANFNADFNVHPDNRPPCKLIIYLISTYQNEILHALLEAERFNLASGDPLSDDITKTPPLVFAFYRLNGTLNHQVIISVLKSIKLLLQFGACPNNFPPSLSHPVHLLMRYAWDNKELLEQLLAMLFFRLEKMPPLVSSSDSLWLEKNVMIVCLTRKYNVSPHPVMTKIGELNAFQLLHVQRLLKEILKLDPIAAASATAEYLAECRTEHQQVLREILKLLRQYPEFPALVALNLIDFLLKSAQPNPAAVSFFGGPAGPDPRCGMKRPLPLPAAGDVEEERGAPPHKRQRVDGAAAHPNTH